MMDRLLENNTILKVLAVIVAIFIWFQAGPSSTAMNRQIHSIPVGFPTPNPHVTVASIQPSVVTVTIKGPPKSVRGAGTTNVYALVHLGNVTQSGTYSLKVAASVPEGTSLVSVSPDRVVVTVDRMGQSKVPVTVHTTGKLASGYESTGITASNTRATISGPTGDLAQVKHVVADLALDKHSSNFTAQVILIPVNARGATVSHVDVSPAETTVDVGVQQKPPQKVLPVVSQLSGQPAAGYKVGEISVYPSSVTVSGTQSALASLTHIYTAPVKVGGRTSDLSEAIPLVLPKGISVVGKSDVTVTVTIEPKS